MKTGEVKNDLAHELKSPLAIIKGYAEMTRDELMGPVTEQQTKAMERIIETVARLIELIDEELSNSRKNSNN